MRSGRVHTRPYHMRARSHLLREVHHDRFGPADYVDGPVGAVEHQSPVLTEVVGPGCPV